MLRIKRIISILVVCTLLTMLVYGCSTAKEQSNNDYYTFVDDLGKEVSLTSKPKNIVALMGSYGELWMLSGGAIKGITEDAVSERGLDLGDDVKIIGSIKDPNLEMILDLSPDFVLLSTDVDAHIKLDETLTSAGIAHAYFKVDTFDEYLNMLKICTDINETPDLYEQYGTDIKSQVEDAIEKANSNGEAPKVLLIRSMSTKAKALKEDHMVGEMLKDLNTENIASKYPSLLEDLSMETIIAEDPEFIFVITMGDVNKAIKTLENGIMANPAWSGLSAVKNGKLFILPKELFQYKPNARWGESYEYLEKILYENYIP